MTLRQQYKKLYWAWKSMKQRCLNPKCSAYKNYGGRGIRICERWYSFEPFLEWALSTNWRNGLELDRKDNDGDYSPENCRWVNRRENINNRRCSLIIEINGVSRCRTEWEKTLNLPSGIIKSWVFTHGKSYAVDRLIEVIKCGYKRKDYSRNHNSLPVLCVENGKTYHSIRAAAKELGINNGNISKVVKSGRSTGGYHFKSAL